jgi:alkylation response protein AidB-like acyl-CoA dehydrogenase
MRASETAEVIFEDCFVPDENVCGGESKIGSGFQQAMQILDGGRISIAALGSGYSQRRLRSECEICQGKRAVRAADCQFSGDSL